MESNNAEPFKGRRLESSDFNFLNRPKTPSIERNANEPDSNCSKTCQGVKPFFSECVRIPAQPFAWSFEWPKPHQQRKEVISSELANSIKRAKALCAAQSTSSLGSPSSNSSLKKLCAATLNACS